MTKQEKEYVAKYPDVVRLLKKENITMKQIAKKTKHSDEIVRKVKKIVCPDRKRTPVMNRKNVHKMTPEKYANTYPYVISLLRQGVTVRDVVKQTNISHGLVFKLKTMFVENGHHRGGKLGMKSGTKRAVRVEQYSRDGRTLIATYKSMYAASQAVKKTGRAINPSSIVLATQGKCKCAGGYQWKRVEEKPAKGKQIQEFSKSGNILMHTYKNMAEVVRFYGEDKRNVIYHALNGQQKMAVGRIWKYAE